MNFWVLFPPLSLHLREATHAVASRLMHTRSSIHHGHLALRHRATWACLVVKEIWRRNARAQTWPLSHDHRRRGVEVTLRLHQHGHRWRLLAFFDNLADALLRLLIILRVDLLHIVNVLDELFIIVLTRLYREVSDVRLD